MSFIYREGFKEIEDFNISISFQMEFTTIFEPNLVTSNATHNSLPSWSGFLFLLGSSFFWGSNYLPVKQYETGT